MPGTRIEVSSFESILASLQSLEEDCEEREVDRVCSVVQGFFDQDANFMKLKALQSTLNEKVGFLLTEKESEPSNLAALAKKVNVLVNEVQKRTATSLVKDFKGLSYLPTMVLSLSAVLGIARECLRINPEGTLDELHHFPLFDTPEGIKGFIKLVKPWAKRHPDLIIRFVYRAKLFDKVADREAVINLLKTCVVSEEEVISNYFLKMLIDQIDIKELFDLIVKVNFVNAERALFLYCQFSEEFKDQPRYRLRIAMAIADHEPARLIQGLDYFEIENWELLAKFAIKLASKAPEAFLKQFQHFDTYSEDIRFKLAYLCAKGAPVETIRQFEKFKLEREYSFIYILNCCAMNGWCAGDEEVYKKFKVTNPAEKEKNIIFSIINNNMKSSSEIEKADLDKPAKEKLVLLALCFNYLNSCLSKEDALRFDQLVKPRLQELSKRSLAGEEVSYEKLLRLRDDKSKVIALIAIDVFGFPIDDVRMQKVLKKICRCGNGAHAFKLLETLENIKKQDRLEDYFDLILNEKGSVDESLIILMLFGVKWSYDENPKLLDSIKQMLFLSSKVRKKLAEDGPTLRTFISVLLKMNVPNPDAKITFGQSLAILYLAISYVDEAHFMERLSGIETLYSILRPDLLLHLLPVKGKVNPIEATIQELHDLEEELFPLERQTIEKHEELKAFLSQYKELREEDSKNKTTMQKALDDKKHLAQLQQSLERQLEEIESAFSSRPTEEKPNEKIKHLLAEKAALQEKIKVLDQLIKEKKEKATHLKKQLRPVNLRESELKRELQALEKANKEAKAVREEEVGRLDAKRLEVQAQITAAFREIITNILLSDKTLDLEGVEDLDKKFVKTLGAMRSPNGWKVYQVEINKLESSSLKKVFNQFILSYLNETFREERYQDNCPHNHHMIEYCPEVWVAWSTQDKGEQVMLAEKQYLILNTDDPQDLFLSGTDVEGSCQNIRASVDYNKCLLAYTNDGKNRMIAIKDPLTGRIKARTIFRLLWHKKLKRPVLHIELVYPKEHLPIEFKKALWDYALKEAKRLRCALYCSEELPETKKCEGQALVSMRGRAPFEYVDAASGVTENGEYKITKLYIFAETEHFLVS